MPPVSITAHRYTQTQGCIFYVNILHFPIFVSLIFSRYSTFSYKQRSFFQRISKNCKVSHYCAPYFGLNRGKHNNLPRFRTKLEFFLKILIFRLKNMRKNLSLRRLSFYIFLFFSVLFDFFYIFHPPRGGRIW